jgi:hypothetical protein
MTSRVFQAKFPRGIAFGGQRHAGSILAVPPSAAFPCAAQAFCKKISIERVTGSITKTRLAFHVGGYDPDPPVMVYQRFLRELRRFERTWSVTASVSGIIIEADQAMWNVVTSGPNWQVETQCRLVRWDDVMAVYGRRPAWQRIPLGLLAFADFVAGGALWGYVRTSTRYALFFLYPYVIFAALAALASFAGALIAYASGSALAGIATAAVALVALLQGASRWLYLSLMFDDWIFSRRYIRGGDPTLDRRLDLVARQMVAAARAGEADEILIFGHSLGAVLGIDLVDRALRYDPDFGTTGTRVALVTAGSSIPKIGLHSGAVRFHAALARVAAAANPFWADYQSRADWLNFFKVDPVARSGLKPTGRPVVRNAHIREMVDPIFYSRLRRNFYRLHCQFVSGNERRAAYDYFMLFCGPLSAEHNVQLPDGARSAIGDNGALLAAPAEMALEHPRETTGQ